MYTYKYFVGYGLTRAHEVFICIHTCIYNYIVRLILNPIFPG